MGLRRQVSYASINMWQELTTGKVLQCSQGLRVWTSAISGSSTTVSLDRKVTKSLLKAAFRSKLPSANHRYCIHHGRVGILQIHPTDLIWKQATRKLSRPTPNEFEIMWLPECHDQESAQTKICSVTYVTLLEWVHLTQVQGEIGSTQGG